MMRELPERPFDAYTPDEHWPWDRRRVNHLLRRLAFGPRPMDVEHALANGPAELLVGAIYALDCGANAVFLRDQLARMGQNLLFPPDVSGWDGQEAWINSNTLVQRYNFALQLVRQQEDQFFKRLNLNAYLRDNQLQAADRVVDHFSDRLLDGPLHEAERAVLIDYMNRDEKNNARVFEAKDDQVRHKARGAIRLLMCRPAFQLG